jgi:hypothetical protein
MQEFLVPKTGNLWKKPSAVQMVRELVKEEETISRRSNNWIEGLTRR